MNESNTSMPAPALSPAERKELRAQAHHLDPVVMIGDAGLSEPVLAEARRALAAHELIKIRVFGDDRELRQQLMQQLCEELGCAPVQMIGKLLVVYRPRDSQESEVSSLGLPRKRVGEHRAKKALGSLVESGADARKPTAKKPRSTGRKSTAKTGAKTGAKSATRSAAKPREKTAARPGTRSGATPRIGARTAPRSRSKG